MTSEQTTGPYYVDWGKFIVEGLLEGLNEDPFDRATRDLQRAYAKQSVVMRRALAGKLRDRNDLIADAGEAVLRAWVRRYNLDPARHVQCEHETGARLTLRRQRKRAAEVQHGQ